MTDDREPEEQPFALISLGWLLDAAGVLLVLGSVSRLATGESGAGLQAALVIGSIELVVGIALGAGARWAYRATLMLMPANLAGSVVLMFVLGALLLVWSVAFALAILVLYGPPQVFAGTHGQIHAWLHADRDRVRTDGEATAEPIAPHGRRDLAA